jgi:subtilisin-like proprotein convertase family protein
VTPLAGLNGKSVHGTWKLWVENRGPGRGTLNSWSLTVTAK